MDIPDICVQLNLNLFFYGCIVVYGSQVLKHQFNVDCQAFPSDVAHPHISTCVHLSVSLLSTQILLFRLRRALRTHCRVHLLLQVLASEICSHTCTLSCPLRSEVLSYLLSRPTTFTCFFFTQFFFLPFFFTKTVRIYTLYPSTVVSLSFDFYLHQDIFN